MMEGINQTDHDKLQKVAKRLRIAVWVFCAAMLVIFIVDLCSDHADIHVKHSWTDNAVVDALQERSMFPTALFAGIQQLELLLVIGFMFWLQRLFGLFGRGEYFSNQSVTCCLWLAWLFITILVIPILQQAYLFYLGKRFLPPEVDVSFTLHLNLGSLVLIVMLPMIIYLLRIAQTLELENKEFI
ncbi:MAG: hypothetical protein AAF512_26395 [Pseudomonadota bacterium]